MYTAFKAISGLLTVIVVLVSAGFDVPQPPFYIAEAKQPAGFPQPGKANEIIVKSYPLYRSAKVNSAGKGEGRMFSQLFEHIKSSEIAMTAPVEMTFNASGQSSMAFMYERPDVGAVGIDNHVEVADRPPTQVVSIAVRGNYTKARFDDCCQSLREWLARSDQWKACGEPRYLAFNSPFVPSFLRYGEVQIPIQNK